MAIRPFIDTLREIEYGHLLDDIAKAQQEVLDAVSDTRKKGQIVITLDYIPEGDGQVNILADLKQKAPSLPRGKTLFFVTPERNLSRQDPRQIEINGLRKVEDTTETRSVSNG